MVDVNDRCQRWRKIAIDQLSYVLNLTLTFAIATLGYCFALLKDEHFVLGDLAKWTMIFAMFFLTFSVPFGFTCALVRLRNFRGTARRACDHPDKPTKNAMRDLDSATWRIFLRSTRRVWSGRDSTRDNPPAHIRPQAYLAAAWPVGKLPKSPNAPS